MLQELVQNATAEAGRDLAAKPRGFNFARCDDFKVVDKSALNDVRDGKIYGGITGIEQFYNMPKDQSKTIFSTALYNLKEGEDFTVTSFSTHDGGKFDLDTCKISGGKPDYLVDWELDEEPSNSRKSHHAGSFFEKNAAFSVWSHIHEPDVSKAYAVI